MKPRVLVLLSAFNGQSYLEEQMESVLTQEGDFTLRLRVRDDGSTDRTEEIVRKMSERFPGRVEYEKGRNLGYNASFFALIDGVRDCDFVALCDQDDKWLPGKIQAGMAAIRNLEGPALYCAPSVMTDAALKPIGLTRTQKRPFRPANTLIQNICPGHNQLMNTALLKLVQQERDLSGIYVYDLWIENIAALKGNIVFDKTPRTLYRQHSANELGSRGSGLGKLLKAGERALSGEGEKNKMQMAAFARRYRRELETIGLYEAVQEMLTADSFGKRLRFIRHCPFYRQSRLETAAFKAAFLLGKY